MKINTKKGFRKNAFIFTSIFCITLSACQCFGVDPNLVGWWKFDEGSGTIANDSSGHNNNGTVSSSAAWITGQVNGALNFDGSRNYISIPDNDNSLDMDNQMTISAWVKPNSTDSLKTIVSKQPPGIFDHEYPGNYNFRITNNPSFLQLLHKTGTSTDTSYISTSIVTFGIWQHVAVTLKEGDSVKFYINGIEAGILPQTEAFGIFDNGSVLIGAQLNSVNYFNGPMDDVRIYNRALSATEIQHLYYEGTRKAINPVPANGKLCVDPNVILSWLPGAEALSHNVYFGTVYNEVNNANINDANVYRGNQDSNSWDPGILNTATYYWRIDESGSYGAAKGNIWNFTISSPSKATNPVPANGSSCVDPNVILSWLPGNGALSHDVYFGTNYSEVNNADINDANVYIGNQDSNSWNPGILNAAIYYWRIDERGFYGTTKGNIWSFATISPSKATNPVPANGASCMDSNVILSWHRGVGALSQDVYFGTDYSEVNNANINDANVYMGNQDVNNWNPGGLDSGTNYYWRIDERGFYGTTKGNIWSFTTISYPDKATNPVPADDANNLHPDSVVLNWIAGSGCTNSHDVYFGTSFSDVNEANSLSVEFKGNQTATSYNPGVLEINKSYFWRIDEKNSFGTTKGNIWNFTTNSDQFPLKASNPVPANGAIKVSLTQVLSWTAGIGATSHDVYFGTVNPPPFIGNQAGTSYNPGTLVKNKFYYVRVIERNNAGTSAPLDWSFTTECFPHTYTTYNDWVTMGRPDCWCSAYQCDGDGDGMDSGGAFKYRIFTGDLNMLCGNWKKKISDYPATLNPCVDIDHKDSGGAAKYRVYTNDLNIIQTNWKKKNSQLPGNCPRN
jgi:hypothetical protein